jgi:MFS family permease
MPILGIICDKFGKRQAISISGGLFLLLGHVIYLYHGECNQCWTALVPFIFYGFGYSIFIIVLWGSVSFMVPSVWIGTAYGILTCFLNTGATILPYVVS